MKTFHKTDLCESVYDNFTSRYILKSSYWWPRVICIQTEPKRAQGVEKYCMLLKMYPSLNNRYSCRAYAIDG